MAVGELPQAAFLRICYSLMQFIGQSSDHAADRDTALERCMHNMVCTVVHHSLPHTTDRKPAGIDIV